MMIMGAFATVNALISGYIRLLNTKFRLRAPSAVSTPTRSTAQTELLKPLSCLGGYVACARARGTMPDVLRQRPPPQAS